MRIVGIEALTAAQGVEFRAPLITSAELAKAIAAIRAVVPTLEEDRYMATDLSPPPISSPAASSTAPSRAASCRAWEADMAVFEVARGSSPVILGFPHTGTDVPATIWDRLNDNGQILADTDWHIHRLYDGLLRRRDDGARHVPSLRRRR